MTFLQTNVYESLRLVHVVGFQHFELSRRAVKKQNEDRHHCVESHHECRVQGGSFECRPPQQLVGRRGKLAEEHEVGGDSGRQHEQHEGSTSGFSDVIIVEPRFLVQT